MAIESGRSLANEINGFVAIRTNGKPQFNLNDPNTCNQELNSVIRRDWEDFNMGKIKWEL